MGLINQEDHKYTQGSNRQKNDQVAVEKEKRNEINYLTSSNRKSQARNYLLRMFFAAQKW